MLDQSIVTQTRNIVSAAFSSDRKTFTGVRRVLSFLVLFAVSRFSKRGRSFGLNINFAAVAWAVRFGGNQQLTSRISMSSSGLNRLCGEISLHLIWRALYNSSPFHFLSIIALLIINLVLTKGLEVMIMFERVECNWCQGLLRVSVVMSLFSVLGVTGSIPDSKKPSVRSYRQRVPEMYSKTHPNEIKQ